MLLALLLAASLADVPVAQDNEPPAPAPPAPSEEAPPVPLDAAPVEKAPVARLTAPGTPPSHEADAARVDAAIRAAFGGGIGTGIGWALGIGLLSRTPGIAGNFGAGGILLAAMFFGSPIALGGLGSFFGALAATRDPASSLLAGGGGALAVAATLAAGAVLFSFQPSGQCGPSEEQVLVAFGTLVATPFAGAAGGAAGAFFGASAGDTVTANVDAE